MYLPVGHEVHVATPTVAATLLYFPAAQSVQVAEEVVELLPEAQAVQALAPPDE